ncbi:MAG: hypothetical protein ABW003_05820 [Microvirga sp.]
MISGTAFDQLQGKLQVPIQFAGEQRVKNISRPIRTSLVRVPGKPAVRLPRLRVSLRWRPQSLSYC